MFQLMVTKQQLATTGQRKSNTYGHVQSRIQTVSLFICALL